MTDHPFDKTDLLSYITDCIGEEQRRAIEAHLPSCPSCRAYCAEIQAEKDSFLAAHPFEKTITLQQHRRPGVTRLAFPGRQYLALAASLVLFFSAGYLYLAGKTRADYRTKGEPASLTAFVQNRRGTIEKRKAPVYHPGEKIQFFYSCGAENRLVLLGIDTAGVTTIYYPASGDSSSVLDRGRDLPLPNSIVLDAYTGQELFIALFSKEALYVPEVKRQALDAFAGSHCLDSIELRMPGAIIVKHDCSVLADRGGSL